jgi:ornithine cyclodeaminase/alanine dehydrogenase-like protein (mu-crystallin family)
MVLFDAATGSPLAVMDAATLTAVRTGAASGAATDLLARPDAEAAAVFGAGVQGRTQLEAVCAVRTIRRARVFDVDAAAAGRFADEMAEHLGIAVEAAATPAEALAGAEVVCTATTASQPVFDDADLAPGVHLNAVGAYQPPAREVPAETVCRARVVVDQRAAALEEAGDLVVPLRDGLITEDHIAAEVGEILAGRAAGRESPEQVTLFKSVGVAVEDVAAAAAALAGAERLGFGTAVRL